MKGGAGMRTPKGRGARESTAFIAALIGLSLVAPLAGCGLFAPPPGSLPPSAPPSASRPSEPPAPVSEPPTLSGPFAPPKGGAYIGVYHPPAPFEVATLDDYARISDKPPAILMWYQPWAPNGPRDFDAAACVSVYDRKAVPMITWEPWDPGKNANLLKEPAKQPAYQLADIIGGQHDDYIRAFARGVRSVRGPVMIRPMHEMNGNWYPWCGTVNGNQPAQYVAAWRHIHDLFEEEGATNVTWVWSINHETVPDSARNRPAAYYPGDTYVDWVAMSGFNWGTTSPYSAWKSFDFRYRKPLAYLKTLKKPIVIAEFGSVENGGNKAEWITDAYKRIRAEHPEVKAVVYYDNREQQPKMVQDWRISSSKASAKAYRSAVGNTYFRAGPASTLASWTSGLSPLNREYLRALTPVY